MATDLRPLPQPDPPDPDALVRPTEAPEPRDTSPVVLALELGWRIAVLYADLEHPIHAVGEVQAVPACLPAVETMPNGDQLEVQVRAAASLAFQLKASSHCDALLALAGPVHAACHSRRETVGIRGRLRECHTKLVKELWFKQEAQGKAYELGTSLFDTWNRVRLAARTEAGSAVAADSKRSVDEWRAVFDPGRIERIKHLLDDLQTQLPHTAVTVVKAHLEFWRQAVAEHVEEGAAAPWAQSTEVLAKQTIIWRQLLTEAKQPEAFLRREDRREVHRQFKQLVWRSFLRPLPIVAGLAAVAVLAGLMSGVIHVASPGQSFVALLGAIGLSQASLAVIARDRIREWTGLLWNRALANVVFEATCLADEVFEWKQTSVSCSLADAGRRLTRRPPRSLPSRPTSQL
jgi:hypothetical protein